MLQIASTEIIYPYTIKKMLLPLWLLYYSSLGSPQIFSQESSVCVMISSVVPILSHIFTLCYPSDGDDANAIEEVEKDLQKKYLLKNLSSHQKQIGYYTYKITHFSQCWQDVKNDCCLFCLYKITRMHQFINICNRIFYSHICL